IDDVPDLYRAQIGVDWHKDAASDADREDCGALLYRLGQKYSNAIATTQAERPQRRCIRCCQVGQIAKAELAVTINDRRLASTARALFQKMMQEVRTSGRMHKGRAPHPRPKSDADGRTFRNCRDAIDGIQGINLEFGIGEVHVEVGFEHQHDFCPSEGVEVAVDEQGFPVIDDASMAARNEHFRYDAAQPLPDIRIHSMTPKDERR